MKATTEQKELFTAGEWRLNKGIYYTKLINQDNEFICQFENYLHPKNEDEQKKVEANSSLISESKNMYYALNKMTEHYEALIKVYEHITKSNFTPENYPSIIEAKEILNRINKQ